MPSSSLSLCMIVRDEAVFLERCLSAIKDYVDEIVVVDTGSVDSTRQIASTFTQAVYDFTWIDDFSAARNYSLAKASSDWIIVLDADEQIAGEDLLRIRKLLDTSRFCAYSLVQRNYSSEPEQGDWIPLEGPTPYSMDYLGYRENPIVRLFKNRQDIRFTGRIHELIDHKSAGITVQLTDIPIHHDINGNPEKSLEERQLNYLRIIEKELLHRPSGRLYANAGAVCLYYKKDYDKAVEYYQKAVELEYDKQVSLEGVAEAHYRLENHKAAYDIYTSLIGANYRSPTLCNNLANLLVMIKDYPTARRILKMALEFDNPDIHRVARIQKNIEALDKLMERQ
jgi:glycosyltransferase involved in cell wall biosynthesis